MAQKPAPINGYVLFLPIPRRWRAHQLELAGWLRYQLQLQCGRPISAALRLDGVGHEPELRSQ